MERGVPASGTVVSFPAAIDLGRKSSGNMVSERDKVATATSGLVGWVASK